jgi:hypothetical protein
LALIFFVNRAFAAWRFFDAELLGIKLEQSTNCPTSLPITANLFHASTKTLVQASASSAKFDQVSAVYESKRYCEDTQ